MAKVSTPNLMLSSHRGIDDSAIDTMISAGETETLAPGTILKGKIIGRAGDDVVVDVGLKSEGIIAVNEWDDRSAIDIGDEIDVYLENIESESGIIELSKRKADRILNWNRITQTKAGRRYCPAVGR